MYQYEKRLDCRTLGKEIKRRRKAKGWTQEHLAQLVDLTPRSIMYIENRGQHTSLNSFYKLVTLLDISVDEFFYPDKLGGESERRKHLDRMLNGMDKKELISWRGPQRASARPVKRRGHKENAVSVFRAISRERTNGKQGKCQYTCDFCSAKMLVGVAPQTRRKPLDTVSRGFCLRTRRYCSWTLFSRPSGRPRRWSMLALIATTSRISCCAARY